MLGGSLIHSKLNFFFCDRSLSKFDMRILVTVGFRFFCYIYYSLSFIRSTRIRTLIWWASFSRCSHWRWEKLCFGLIFVLGGVQLLFQVNRLFLCICCKYLFSSSLSHNFLSKFIRSLCWSCRYHWSLTLVVVIIIFYLTFTIIRAFWTGNSRFIDWFQFYKSIFSSAWVSSCLHSLVEFVFKQFTGRWLDWIEIYRLGLWHSLAFQISSFLLLLGSVFIPKSNSHVLGTLIFLID